MGNYENLKQSITEVIRTNGNQEITGAVLQSTLLTIISTVGANATFAGIATPTTNPGTPDGSVFWLASESGTYTNFNAIELQDGLSILMWNGSWSSQQIFGVDDVPTAGSNNLVKSGGVQEELALGAIYDVSAKNPTAGTNNDGKFESLSALLEDANLNTLIPTTVRKGGMSIKFVQSTDNNYKQFRCIADEFTTDVTKWQGVSDEPISESEDLVKGSGVLSKYAPLGGIIYRNKNSMDNNHTVRFDVGYTCWNKDMILTWDSNSSINMVSIHCYSKDYEHQLLYTANDIFNVPQNTAIIVATFDNGDSSTEADFNLSFYGTSQKLDKILQKNWDFGYSYGQLPNVDTLGMTINFGDSAYIKLPYTGIDLGNFTDIPLVDTSLNTSLQLLVYNITQNSFAVKSYTYLPKDDEIILCITRWSTHEPVKKILDVFSKFDVTYDGIRNQSGLVLASITSIDKLWCNLVWYTQYHTRVIFEIDNTPYSELNISLDASQDYDVDVLNAENWEGTHYDETGWQKSVLGYKATKKDAKKIFVLFRKSNNEEITVADVALIKAAIVQCDIKNILLKGNANNNLLYQLNKKIAIDKNPNIISIAHQGFCFNNPSQFSTLEAFLRAADYGFRWTEGDIKFSSDLVPVLNHDLTFEDATTHQTITISEHTYAELLTYDYKGGNICSFDEVLAICKTSGMGFVIDHLDWTVDTDQKLNIIFSIVKKYRMENNVIWNIQNNGKVDKITQFYKYSIFQILNGYSSESLSLANAIKTDFNRVIISQDIILDRQGTPRTITPQEIIAFSDNVNNGIELALWTFDYISTFYTLAPYVTWVTTNILTF